MTAPVVLFAYNRPDHLARTLAALRANTLAPGTLLYVYSDGPKSPADASGVAQVRDLARSLDGFASVRLIEREANMGLARSVIAGVSEVLGEHGRAVVLEDDLVTSPRFLEYMNTALVHYRDDPKVMSVTGYTFPERGLRIPPDYAFDAYSHYRCSSWSWGTWADRWSLVDWDMTWYDALMDDERLQAAFLRGGPDMLATVAQLRAGKIDAWAIRFCYAHAQNDMRCIYPVKSLVNNIGLDGSGRHCLPDPRRQHQSLEADWLPTRLCPANPVDPVIDERFRAAFAPEPQPLARRLLSAPARVAQRGLAGVRSLADRARQGLLPPAREVDVLAVNTQQRDGGAARAAWRTFNAVQALRPDSRYLTLYRQDPDPRVTGIAAHSTPGLAARVLSMIDTQALRLYPHRQDAPFSPSLLANPLRTPLGRFRPRLLHLHWVLAGMLRVEELAAVGCPVVWTLHDTWPFTGGCHYPGPCEGFTRECGRCPQLGSNREHDLSRRLMRRKAKVFEALDLTVVTPSRWMADMAGRSSLFGRKRIEVIPNGLDMGVFKPVDQNAARRYLDLAPGEPVFLAGALKLTDRRKGMDLLVEALSLVDFPCTLLTFGHGSMEPVGDHVRVRPLGLLADDISLAVAYSAADVFLCPSREDNLPNTVAEALACGTPCAAFDANGLPDMIEHKRTGWLAKAFDARDFANGLRHLAFHPDAAQLREACRAKALAAYGQERMGAAYVALFEELLATSRG